MSAGKQHDSVEEMVVSLSHSNPQFVIGVLLKMAKKNNAWLNAALSVLRDAPRNHDEACHVRGEGMHPLCDCKCWLARVDKVLAGPPEEGDE